MIYEAINQPKKMTTALLDKAVVFACDYLDLDIDLIIEFETMRPYQYGNCDYDGEDGIIVISKRLSKADIIKTLFHEMVHVKQFVDGRLEAGSPSRWLGEVYSCDYDKLPWEVEAFEIEATMVNDFYR